MEPSNYRPISIIKNIAKIWEKAMRKRLCDHLSYYNIISAKEFGFREKISTEDALFSFTDKVHNALNENKQVLAIFLDMVRPLTAYHIIFY